MPAKAMRGLAKHVLVVLDVLADLPALFAFEPWSQDRQGPFDPQLIRRARVTMRKRQVGGAGPRAR